ncbi:hypothetical protein PHYSODRAFT_339772 [Phytophthora sojae]|uniref:RxLR effector protein n=1 Tax=Phytophthora sojae (strain P6497) TaxID=1094619 RepID=G5A7J7_PHYSP|nr:hypothetical protein PHYSODRAFT_339772 [Phytophthora sojae]EGZ07873.1 hypothetical protein PHYSODRAFT_339772 [Phytophthora sojae]|eukprot:XP_009536045.1 hypothetical protein PHYSODRAFT_339772 [Phytophthora sojae]
MQLIQLLFVTMLVLLASSNAVDAASKCGVKTTVIVTNGAANNAPSKSTNSKLELTNLAANDEERGAGVNTGAAARATGAGAIPINGPSGGVEMVTVTTFNGNGVWQKMKRWLNGLFSTRTEPSRSTRRLRQ